MDRQLRYGAGGLERRTALKIGLSIALAPRWAAAQADPARERPREGDVLVAADTDKPTPLASDALPLGGKPTMAWPMEPESGVVRNGTRLNKVLLLRLDPKTLDPTTTERAADGVVAYSAICPHAGCDVSVWHADSQLLQCPCHYSEYDPKAAGRVVSGPAPRSLPALPLKTVENRLVVARPFTGRVGFQQS